VLLRTSKKARSVQKAGKEGRKTKRKQSLFLARQKNTSLSVSQEKGDSSSVEKGRKKSVRGREDWRSQKEKGISLLKEKGARKKVAKSQMTKTNRPTAARKERGGREESFIRSSTCRDGEVCVGCGRKGSSSRKKKKGGRLPSSRPEEGKAECWRGPAIFQPWEERRHRRGRERKILFFHTGKGTRPLACRLVSQTQKKKVARAIHFSPRRREPLFEHGGAVPPRIEKGRRAAS